MLPSFNEAIARATSSTDFDALAQKAKDILSAAAVVIFDVGKREMVGACAAGTDISAKVLHSAAKVPPTLVRVADPFFTEAGEGLDAAPPFARVINLALGTQGMVMLCMIFPVLPGIQRASLARFVEIGERRLREIAVLRRYRDDLKRYVTMFHQMERTARAGIWELDPDGRTVLASEEALRVLGLPSRARVVSSRAIKLFDRPERRELLLAIAKASAGAEPQSLALPVRTATGRKRAVRIFISRHAHTEVGFRIGGVIQDVTEEHQATERLWWTANHDPLTELPNRALFSDRFRNALERRARSRRLVCLILVDVDNFKFVNDTFGHGAGDALLMRVARQLRASVRTHDTVARTGGDEFSILMEDIEDEDALTSVLKRLRASLDLRFTWEAHTVNVTLSAGAAIAPDHGREDRDLNTAADLALYKSKGVRSGVLTLYEPAFGRAEAERSRLLDSARQALRAGSIVPFYQPQVDIASGRIVGVEALARWITPEGVRTATEFHEALADHDVGPLISQAVVDKAIVDLAELNRNRADKIALSVNASAGDLMRAKFLDRIGTLHREGEELGPITVEITEDVILDDPNGLLAERMQRAQDAGLVRFALDDFGTGYGSFVHITTLPISEIKVDRRFVTGIEDDRQKRKVIEGILSVARSLGLRVVLEGVENASHVRAILELGGKYVQGFHFAHALAFADLAELVRQQDAPSLAA